ncbi:MAG: DEAD/DEAH box helicase [Treponema sp.]|jgi:ATP-dependent RNA helicase RhlB|nr:DEAD/DEAH box helicase [Treponema sp.]
MEFTELNLHMDLQKGITEAGYLVCTPVQEQVLKHAFNGQDLYVQSQTGTGKTAAFLIVIFQRLLTEPLLNGKRALIMAPTRELAVQIEEEAKLLATYLSVKIGSFYGGVGYGQQQQLLRGNVQVLIGTPGRVLDLNGSGQMNLMDIAFLVIDEADRMFDMGFYPDLRKLVKVTPPVDRRQTMLFSATLNTWVKNLAWEYTKTPFEIEIAPETITVEEVKQLLYHVPSEGKMRLLLGILEREQPESAIIFCNTKRYTEIIAKRLSINGYDVEFIIGDLPQYKRLKIIEEVKAGKTRFLVATDVAARGLDIEGLALVVNYDLPAETENYVHRIGRTARAGKTGKAISFASEQDVYELAAIEKYIEMKIPSKIAGEYLYAEDKSAGKSVRTGLYDEQSGFRDKKGSAPDRERSGGSRRQRKGGQEDGSRRGTSRGDKATRTSSRISEKSGRNGRRGFPPTRGFSEQTGALEGVDLSAMSFEERMAYYRLKYAKGAVTTESAGAAEAAERQQNKPREESAHKRRRRRSRQRKQSPDSAALNGSASATKAPVPEKAARKGRQDMPAAGNKQANPAKTTLVLADAAEKSAKKSFFAKIFGFFKKGG